MLVRASEFHLSGIGRRCYSLGCFAKVKTVQEKQVKPNAEKIRIANEILDSFNSSQFAAVYHYNDVNCQDWRRIRSKLGKNNIKLKVVPVKLTAKILQPTKYKNVATLLKGTTVIAFGESSGDITHLVAGTKKENKLHMMGGIVEDQLVTPKGIKECAKMQPLAVQQMELSRTLTSLQVQLSRYLLSSQQHLCSQLERIHDS